jgi:Mor family transcriptional regulator
MMDKFLLLLLFLLAPWKAMPQDERYFRQIFSGELAKSESRVEDKKYSFFFHTPYYALDLNHDGNPEQILFVKKDGEDWLEIYQQKNGEKTKIFSYRFDALGFDSELFRIEFKRLSSKTSIILMHYYEGVSRYLELQATSRIYAGTIDNDDLKTLSVLKGPSFFEEHDSKKGHYHLRNYEVFLKDLNSDEVRELIIKYRLVSQVFLYSGEGKWKTFSN